MRLRDHFQPDKESHLNDRLSIVALIAIATACLFSLSGSELDKYQLIAARWFSVSIPLLTLAVLLIGRNPPRTTLIAYAMTIGFSVAGLLSAFVGLVAYILSIDQLSGVMFGATAFVAAHLYLVTIKLSTPREKETENE